MTQTYGNQSPLEKTYSYLKKMTFGGANSTLILFVVYCLKHLLCAQ